jgi:hypothetical protein
VDADIGKAMIGAPLDAHGDLARILRSELAHSPDQRLLIFCSVRAAGAGYTVGITKWRSIATAAGTRTCGQFIVKVYETSGKPDGRTFCSRSGKHDSAD